MTIDINHWNKKIININNYDSFNQIAIEAFNFQYNNIGVYRQYVDMIGVNAANVDRIEKIPFLPVDFFRTKKILYNKLQAKIVFRSSGTTSFNNSQHFVNNLSAYDNSLLNGFTNFYGNPANYAILALLPSYLERADSSLVYMVRKLIEVGRHQRSGFFLNNYNELSNTIVELDNNNQKILLIGVTFALLDMAEKFDFKLNNIIIMETGGMKGRRKELIRDELHKILCSSFGVNKIHSEYGMTEMLSQAYSLGDGIYSPQPWMQILIRDVHDPFNILHHNQHGAINVIDLANIFSCCFIETMDLGMTFINNTFTVLGRLDNSQIRGCNLMVQ